MSEPTSGQNPIQKLVEILKDEKLAENPKDKELAIEKWGERFQHRRRIAYIALLTIIVLTAAVLLIAAYVDEGAKKMNEIESMLISTQLFLAGLVGAYYGTTAFKPGS